MTQQFLVIYDHTSDTTGKTITWGGFSPDIPGCVSVGDTLEEMRTMMTEAIESRLEWMAEDGDILPEPKISTVDFADRTPAKGVAHSIVEWLEVRMPAQPALTVQQAALTSAIQEQAHHG